MIQDIAGAATFLCGHPKTGTSLLLTLLDSHPQLVVYPEETGYFRWFASHTRKLGLQQKIDLVDQLLTYSFHWDPENIRSRQGDFPDRDYAEVPHERVRAQFHAFLDEMGPSDANLLSAAVLAYGKISGQLGKQTRRWVEKTPYHELHADLIYSLWPEAKCIQLIRDPRDTFASYRRKHTDWRPETMALSWGRSTHHALRNSRRFGEDRYLVLRYEDLVENVRGTIARVREFLGLEDDPILYQPTRAGKPWGGNSMFDETFQGVSRRPIGRFRSALSSSEIKVLEAALRGEMERFGYPRESSLSLMAWLSWQVYSWKNRMYRALKAAGLSLGGD